MHGTKSRMTVIIKYLSLTLLDLVNTETSSEMSNDVYDQLLMILVRHPLTMCGDHQASQPAAESNRQK